MIGICASVYRAFPGHSTYTSVFPDYGDGSASMADMALDPLSELRSICLSFPEVTERVSHGEPAWFVRDKKLFVTYADHHHDDRVAFWYAAPEGAQETLVASDPHAYFRPPYVGPRGWLGVYLDIDDVDWAAIADLVEDAYRTVAPKTLVARLDAGE